MATFKSVEAFAREVDKMDRRIAKETAKAVTFEQARQAQKIARRAASADLGGDPKFSGWAPRLATVVKPTRNSGHILTPTRSSAGPWTVAEQGRNKGDAGGFAGPGVNRRTGVTSRRKDGSLRKVRRSRGRRWNGYTAGKSTASEAVAEMDRTLPRLGDKELKRAIAKHFDVS